MRTKQKELHDEIVKTKQRRQQREIEEEREEQMRAVLAKEMELEQNLGWETRETEFHKQTAVQRSILRIQNMRQKPIDILVRCIHNLDSEIQKDAPQSIYI